MEKSFPPLLRALSEAVETGSLPDSMQEAIIVVHPKPGKDRLLPDSYSLISLLNSDIKLLARVLATRLSKVIGGLVHRDQSGFIPTGSTADNIQRLFMNLQVPMDDPGEGHSVAGCSKGFLQCGVALPPGDPGQIWSAESFYRLGEGSVFKTQS